MKNKSMNIETLGFNKWFQDKIDSAKLTDYEIAFFLIFIAMKLINII